VNVALVDAVGDGDDENEEESAGDEDRVTLGDSDAVGVIVGVVVSV
jgi:hypothetical protein